MHPADIKSLLEKAGYSQADVARMWKKSKSLVCRVIQGTNTSRPTQELIAELVGKPVNELWPPMRKAG